MPELPDLIAADFASSLANTAPWIWRDQREHLPDLRSLRRLLAEHGLDHDGLTQPDVGRARDLRAQLRAPFDADSDVACAAAINELLVLLAPVPQLNHGPDLWSVQVRCPSGWAIDDVAASSVLALADLVAIDGRHRLHHCAAENCHGVFIDTTRNRSRRFCMPELCGNRTKVTAHRRRKRQI